MDNIVCSGRSISQITQIRRCLFSKNINFFCHLKLEIALAIPASNDEKYNLTSSAGQGLIVEIPMLHKFIIWEKPKIGVILHKISVLRT